MAEKTVDVSAANAVAIGLETSADTRQVCEAAARMAGELGFPQNDCNEINLAVSELGSNLLRYASRGAITLTRLNTDGRQGIRIESEDEGPGIPDPERAITDGYSTGGGLGFGLGAVNRLMDELEFYPGPRGGLHIVCQRWVRPRECGTFDRGLVFGAATRPRRAFDENGDAFLIKQWERNALVGVIDGLGHGPFAHRASRAARQYVEQHFDQPLEQLFRGAGRVCRGTRGVVMALARFELAQHRVRIGNIGNIGVRLLGSPERVNLQIRRGIVGLNAPAVVVTEHPWNSNSVLMMYSDGISTLGDWAQFREPSHQNPDELARKILDVLGDSTDDATVVIARSAGQ